MNTMKFFVARALAGLGFYLCIAAAWAHAHPVSLSPAADAAVSAPAEIRIVYDKALEPESNIVVSNERNEVVATGRAVLVAPDNLAMSLALPALPVGGYTVQWSAGSHDGHTAKGSYKFIVK
ncbi:copper resistance CopC family protein [Undibacterium terreum]|uniref:Copper-resistance exported protein n=1 Tax=Undibacterium terreum TaxID=1224302 RepID=A0A916X9H9_9BURK|nr:copper resistance protein CopC [Undibacterium terreum]GGC57327.1 copper-resistance exported protein [Undibacterium terreum]